MNTTNENANDKTAASPTATQTQSPTTEDQGQLPRKPVSRLRWIAAATVVLVLVLVGIGIRNLAAPRDDATRFQGRWQLLVPMEGGERQPEARRVPHVTILVRGEQWVWLIGDTEQKRYAMTLRPDTNPREIDLTQLAPDGQPLMQQWPPPTRPVMIRGIYSIEGSRAKIVTAIGGEDRPLSIDATEGVTVWLLERLD